MSGKEKCKKLKEIRKEVADKLGIDLKQTECTYKGECSGTCPKCSQEEEILNTYLLKQNKDYDIEDIYFRCGAMSHSDKFLYNKKKYEKEPVYLSGLVIPREFYEEPKKEKKEINSLEDLEITLDNLVLGEVNTPEEKTPKKKKIFRKKSDKDGK